MGNNRKKESHLFMLTDYEREEEFLRRRHREGWRLLKVTLPGFYTFEKCEPEDVVYRLDFNPQNPGDKQSYLQMYADYGWEYVQDLNDYSYFRKKAEQVEENELEIFSDAESRIEMLKRIFVKRILPLVIVFAVYMMTQLPYLLFGNVSAAVRAGLLGLMAFIVLLYSWVFIHCGIGFYKLKKKYQRGTEQ